MRQANCKDLAIPPSLANTCREKPDRQQWLAGLPATVGQLALHWDLDIDAPYQASKAAWVAPARNRSAVLKVGMPHMEATHEIDGMRYWDGNPTARVLAFDRQANAMLLERCEPGIPLNQRPDAEQDEVLGQLLPQLWREPPASHPFRHLSVMTERWATEGRQRTDHWIDVSLRDAGLALFEELPHSATRHVLLATDLHAGNVLQAQRQPWLVIDPKPFVGDPAYDVTQHLFNCTQRLFGSPMDVMGRIAELCAVDAERVRLWMFARATVMPPPQADADFLAFVRAIAP